MGIEEGIDRNMKDNRGLTLIELIVVMVIMGIIAIGSMVGYNMLSTGSVKRTAERISSILDYVQLENMTKNKVYYMVIKKDVGDYIVRVVSVNASGDEKIELEEKLEVKNGEITFQNTGLDVTSYSVGSIPTEYLEVSFDKASGGFRQNRLGNIVSKIGVTASSKSYFIRLVTITGKHYIYNE